MADAFSMDFMHVVLYGFVKKGMKLILGTGSNMPDPAACKLPSGSRSAFAATLRFTSFSNSFFSIFHCDFHRHINGALPPELRVNCSFKDKKIPKLPSGLKGRPTSCSICHVIPADLFFFFSCRFVDLVLRSLTFGLTRVVASCC